MSHGQCNFDVQKLSSLVRLGTEFVLNQRWMSSKASVYDKQGLFCKAIGTSMRFDDICVRINNEGQLISKITVAFYCSDVALSLRRRLLSYFSFLIISFGSSISLNAFRWKKWISHECLGKTVKILHLNCDLSSSHLKILYEYMLLLNLKGISDLHFSEMFKPNFSVFFFS